jgi:hypothetical protein
MGRRVVQGESFATQTPVGTKNPLLRHPRMSDPTGTGKPNPFSKMPKGSRPRKVAGHLLQALAQNIFRMS